RRSVRRARGYGSTVAQRVPERRGRRAQDAHCARPRAIEGASCASGGRAASFCSRRGPTQLDTGAPRRRDSKPGGRYPLPLAALQGAAEKRGFRFRRPRHTLKGRQDADAVDRGGLRLKLRKAQALAGDIVLLFCDESEALTHPYLARAWAKRGAD